MGRKKVEIKFIENKKERVVVSANQVTFCKRKHGLLKKAAELATLCGVKVTLMFTDLGESVHYFSNETGLKIEFEHTLKKKKDGAFMYTYTLDDVAMPDIVSIQKLIRQLPRGDSKCHSQELGKSCENRGIGQTTTSKIGSPLTVGEQLGI